MISFDRNGSVFMTKSQRGDGKLKQATTYPAAERHFNGSIMSSRGAWQYHSSTSQMISLDCLQEIVFHIVFNHQTAERMNIIEKWTDRHFFFFFSERLSANLAVHDRNVSKGAGMKS